MTQTPEATLYETRRNNGFNLTVSNPALNSDKLPLLQQVNDRPEAMWEIIEEESATGEGWIHPLGKLTYAVFPTNQYVPEDGVGCHYMLTFNLGDEYAKPTNTPNKSIETASSQIDYFLDSPNTFACYNMYYGTRDKKKPSMSWRNWHIHCIKVPPEELDPREKGNASLREPGDRLREQFFQQQFEEIRTSSPELVNTLTAAAILSPDEEDQYSYPFNGIVARMPRMNSEDIAQSFIDIDSVCKLLHKNIFEVSVANYDEVAASGWREPYILRPESEVLQLIDQIPSQLAQKFLIRSHRGIMRGLETDDPEKALYPGPCYSVSLYKDQDSLIYVVDPHSFRRNGGLESLGITLIRENEDVTTTVERAARAYAALQI